MNPNKQFVVGAGVFVVAVAALAVVSWSALPRDITIAAQSIAAFVAGGSVVGVYRAFKDMRWPHRNMW